MRGLPLLRPSTLAVKFSMPESVLSRPVCLFLLHSNEPCNVIRLQLLDLY